MRIALHALLWISLLSILGCNSDRQIIFDIESDVVTRREVITLDEANPFEEVSRSEEFMYSYSFTRKYIDNNGRKLHLNFNYPHNETTGFPEFTSQGNAWLSYEWFTHGPNTSILNKTLTLDPRPELIYSYLITIDANQTLFAMHHFIYREDGSSVRFSLEQTLDSVTQIDILLHELDAFRSWKLK